MKEATLAQILQCREDRVRTQQRLIQTYRSPVVSFTMNIAGPVKDSGLIRRAFFSGIAQLEHSLPQEAILFREMETAVTGCQAFYAVRIDAAEVKEACVHIEEATPIGRLFDLDVLTPEGTKLSRAEQRGCIVCGAPGWGCAASRRHSVRQLQTATHQLLADHFARADAARIAALAVQSLEEEVSATPKPGLVDRRNSGSHWDMSMDTFLASAQALMPYFEECVQIGQQTAAQAPVETFLALRAAGLSAEESMLRATGGVNTHKGALFSLGLLCGALGRLWNPEKAPISLPEVQRQCAALGQNTLADFARMTGGSHGEALYHSHGLTGVRGEAASGFPAAFTIGLPALISAQERGLSLESAGIHTLLHLIAQVADTNLHHRGGPEGAVWAAQAARSLLDTGDFPTEEQLIALDDAFIARRLSPGGCADLLSMVFLLRHLMDENYLL